jgi:ribonuclease HI
VQALQCAKGKQVNIYTDSKQAFATLHEHGTIYKERGRLKAGGKKLKTKKKSSNCWKQSGNCLRWLLSTAETTKGAWTMPVEGTA